MHVGETSIIVIGDFNDELFNRSIVEHALGTPDKEIVIHVKTAPRLYNLMWSFGLKARDTFFLDGFNLLEPIMISNGLLNSERKFGIDASSPQILDFEELKKNGKPRKFGRPSDSQGVDERSFSDHYPIAVKIVEE